MALYQLTSSTSIVREADNAIIPTDPANRDYQGYLDWLALGNTPDPAPPPSAALQLSVRIANGITINCAATPSLNATYALDALTVSQIQSVAQDAASGLGLPGGGTSFSYPDITGMPHEFRSPQLIALYRAMRDLLLILNTQAAMVAQGAAPSWPDQSASIA